MRRRLLGTRYWRRRARLQLIHHPLCAMCLARGVTTPATVAITLPRIVTTPMPSFSATCKAYAQPAILGASSRSSASVMTEPSGLTAGHSTRTIQFTDDLGGGRSHPDHPMHSFSARREFCRGPGGTSLQHSVVARDRWRDRSQS